MVLTDFSTLSAEDVAQIALQRTNHLKRYPVVGTWSYRRWLKGSNGALFGEARRRRDAILSGVMSDIEAEFAILAKWLGDRPVSRIMDIGCGHALLDLLFWEKYRPYIHLVDIESTAQHFHNYHNTGSGYASLDSAQRFLVANGVPREKLRATNPTREAVVDENLDLITSTLSAGFHYPISTYTDLALSYLKLGGVLIFDARNGTGQEEMLSGFSSVEVVRKGQKHTTLAAIK